MLVVHHLRRSQSERIVWLCEELGIPYELKCYDREATGAAPPAYKTLHAFGTAPTIQDGDIAMGESGAIAEYICRKHGQGRLLMEPSARGYADFVYWFHCANGTFVPAAMMAMMGGVSLPGMDEARRESLRRMRLERSFETIEQRLGQAPYFAGADLTAADIMMAFPMTTMRMNVPYDLSKSPHTRAYL